MFPWLQTGRLWVLIVLFSDFWGGGGGGRQKDYQASGDKTQKTDWRDEWLLPLL